MQFDLHFVTDTQVKPLSTKGVEFLQQREQHRQSDDQNARDIYTTATHDGLQVSFETAAICDEFTASGDFRVAVDNWIDEEDPDGLNPANG